MQNRHYQRDARRGQALVLCVVSLGVLMGVLALAVEVGWARFVQRQAQSAADAAALAAAEAALKQMQTDGGLAAAGVQSATDCPSSGNLQTGCLYAAENGFEAGGYGGRQTVKIAAGLDSAPPSNPAVTADYWVEAEASHRILQFFSPFIAKTGLVPGARATAALQGLDSSASMHLLNRSSDCFVSAAGIGLVCGEDFLGIGFNDITAPGGIYMSSSNGPGLGLPNISAGTALGTVDVDAPFTYLMGDGSIEPLLGLADIDWNYQNGFPDGDYFTDPMAGKPQPPAPTGLVERPVLGGVIVGGLLPSLTRVMPPGVYYAALSTGPGTHVATGTPITIVGHVEFSDGAGNPCGGFCEYVFYGGLVTGALSRTTFSPGRYILAGAQPVGGGPGVGLTVGANAVIRDKTPLVSGKITQNTDAGQIFIFTDDGYPGLTPPAAITSSGLSFPQVQAGVLVGLGGEVTLHGINPSHPSLPNELRGYGPVLMWQDRANTTLKYQANGLLDRTCGSICNNILSVPGSQEMVIQATQKNGRSGTNLYGIVYGPRGSWLTILGVFPGDTVAGPMQVITGALQMTLNTDLDMELLPNPGKRWVVSLVR